MVVPDPRLVEAFADALSHGLHVNQGDPIPPSMWAFLTDERVVVWMAEQLHVNVMHCRPNHEECPGPSSHMGKARAILAAP